MCSFDDPKNEGLPEFWMLVHKIHHPRITKLCHIIITVHNLWKEEGGLFGCYHCLVMLLPAGKGGNLVFLAFVQLYFSAAQTSISLFCSIVFVCVCTLPTSFHRELWDFKSVEHCGIAPMATYSFMFPPF